MSGSDATRPTVAGSDPQLCSGDAEATLERGEALGRYLIVEPLGAGGMGMVYVAYDPDLDRRVAVKLLRSSYWVGTEGRTRLLREAQAMARLSHPNVVSVYDVGTFGDQVFMAMELVDGATVTGWLADRSRAWEEVVEVFTQAGRGLAAAHAAGIVHRDIKPSNLLVDREGRARVLDFGVARPARDDVADPPLLDADITPEIDESTPASRNALQASLTRVGSAIGTPAYMAPEQRAGTSDARTDQFGFCVTLYEALYGARPPLDDEAGARAPRKDSRVPARIHAAIERGLAADPEARYPSMDALLADLSRARRNYWQWGLLAAAVLVALGTTLFAAVARDTGAVCSGAERTVAKVWNADRREQIRRAFSAVDSPAAIQSWDAVETMLDEYARTWSAMHQDACEATNVRREQSAELLDARMSCLSQRLHEFRSLAEVLARADGEIADRAFAAASGLSDVTACADIETLTTRSAPPTDPAARARYDRFASEIATARGLHITAQYEQSAALLDAAAAETARAGFAALEAEARLTRARVHDALGEVAESEQQLHLAAQAAEAGRDVAAKVEIWTYLVLIVGNRQAKLEEAQRWVSYADAALRSLGAREDLMWPLLERRGLLAAMQGDHEQAIEHLNASLAIAKRLEGEQSLPAGEIHLLLGLSYGGLGKHEQALAHARLDLEITAATRGVNHPAYALSLNNVSLPYIMLGRLAEARDALEQSIALWEARFGPMYWRLAMPLHNLGDLHMKLDAPALAETYYRRSLAVLQGTHGPDYADRAHPLGGLGFALAAQGKYDEARAAHERGIAVWSAAHGDDHPMMSRLLGGLGEIDLATGQPQRALPRLQRAVALIQPDVLTPAQRAQLDYALARALWDTGTDREGARTLAAHARDSLAGDDATAELRKELDAWLDSRRQLSDAR